MGGSAIVTDLGGNQSTLSYFFWVMIIETSRFKLSAVEKKAIINRLMLFTSEKLRRVKQHSITVFQLCDSPLLTPNTPEQDISSCALS